MIDVIIGFCIAIFILVSWTLIKVSYILEIIDKDKKE